MAKRLTIENETHWKTSDIKKIVRMAQQEAGCHGCVVTQVKVGWQRRESRVSYRFAREVDDDADYIVSIQLPRKGAKVQHSNPLVALAAEGISVDTLMLAVRDSYFLANALAYEFARATADTTGEFERVESLSAMQRSTLPPPWADGTNIIITKYADPLKDGSYRDFVAEKQRKLDLAKEREKKYLAEMDSAEKGLKRARRDIRKIERAITEAKARRLKEG